MGWDREGERRGGREEEGKRMGDEKRGGDGRDGVRHLPWEE